MSEIRIGNRIVSLCGECGRVFVANMVGFVADVSEWLAGLTRVDLKASIH